MKQPSDSLGGQNTGSISGSVRSSRTRSTLFKKLRRLDCEISRLDFKIRYFGLDWTKKEQKKRAELDAKRKQVRTLRKAKTV